MGEPRFFEHPRTAEGHYRFETEIMSSMPSDFEFRRSMLPALRWCQDQFSHYRVRWYYGVGEIFITNATDATAFKLRWVDGKVPTDG